MDKSSQNLIFLKEKDLFFTKMEKYLKVILKKVRSRDWVIKIIQINHIILAISKKEKETVKENFIGIMVKYMMVNGKTIKNKEVEFGKGQTMFLMLANGTQIQYKVLEY